MNKITGQASLAKPQHENTPNLESATDAELKDYFDGISFDGPKFPFKVKQLPFAEMPKVVRDAFAALIADPNDDLENEIGRYEFDTGLIAGQRAYFASMDDGGAFAIRIVSQSGRVVYDLYGQDDGD